LDWIVSVFVTSQLSSLLIPSSDLLIGLHNIVRDRLTPIGSTEFRFCDFFSILPTLFFPEEFQIFNF
jgi:hypothetical protein